MEEYAVDRIRISAFVDVWGVEKMNMGVHGYDLGIPCDA